jgi:hypothetical protein
VRASEAANEIVPFLVLRLTESTLKAIGARARAEMFMVGAVRVACCLK